MILAVIFYFVIFQCDRPVVYANCIWRCISRDSSTASFFCHSPNELFFLKALTKCIVPGRTKPRCSATPQLWGLAMGSSNIWAYASREISKDTLLKFSRPGWRWGKGHDSYHIELAATLPCHLQLGISFLIISLSFHGLILKFLSTHFNDNSRYSTVYRLHAVVIGLCRTTTANQEAKFTSSFPMCLEFLAEKDLGGPASTKVSGTSDYFYRLLILCTKL